MFMSRFLARLSVGAACIVSACAQVPDNLNLNVAALLNDSEQATEAEQPPSGDLAIMKQSKWEVVEVKRDGDTLPAQFGQKPGDVISFDTDNNAVIFG